MRLLLDTHAFIWWLEGSAKLTPEATRAIAARENEVMVSAASAWEMTTKYRLGKLPGIAAIVNELAAVVEAEGFRVLDIAFQHACLAGQFDHAHRDPFDRMLIAQSLVEDLAFVSNEALVDGFGVKRIW
jgi:PIN domain nuclease of toxin-antitoxin system